MKYDLCHASKDFIREARLIIDSLKYSETRALENTAFNSVFDGFCAMLIPLIKAGEEMTESLLFLSSYEPLIAIAEETESEFFSMRKGLDEKKKFFKSNESLDDKEAFCLKSKNIIERLIDDLISAEISERLCCDYLRYMMCILESAVRLCGCASEYEECAEALSLERSFERSCRELVRSMRGLLSLIK